MRHALLQKVSRLVVKFGTGILTNEQKQPDSERMRHLVDQIAAERRAGREVVLVSSGAVGAGMGALDHVRRPTQLAELQACAAVGQLRLLAAYEDLFSAHGIGEGVEGLSPPFVWKRSDPSHDLAGRVCEDIGPFVVGEYLAIDGDLGWHKLDELSEMGLGMKVGSSEGPRGPHERSGLALGRSFVFAEDADRWAEAKGEAIQSPLAL